MTKISGLSQSEAKERLKKFGLNQISEKKSVSPLVLFFRQFKNNYLIYLLVIAAILSFLVGKSVTAWTILVVVFLVFITAYIQEYRAERAILALKNMILPYSVVIRDGRETRIESKNIVPGDILLLRTGERVPADGKILKENELRVDEAVLTGESKEVKKIVGGTKEDGSDGKIFMGTFIVSGKCQVEVTDTGMSTEFGKIAGMISKSEKAMPLQLKVNRIVKVMAFIAIFSGLFIGTLLIYRQPVLNYPALIEIMIVVIAIIVSAFPEGFPVVLTSTLASGAYRMAKENAILNRMSTIETLGETTIICSDKTGTITAGEMTVKEIFFAGKKFQVDGAGYKAEGKILEGNSQVESKIIENDFFRLMLKAGIFCNDSRIEEEEADQSYKINGSPTEAAILVLATKAKVFRDDYNVDRLNEIPFSSERKMMSVLVEEDEKNLLVYSKGAPEVIIKEGAGYFDGRKVVKLSAEIKEEILSGVGEMTKRGLRTIAIAYKDAKNKSEDLDSKLTVLGVLGIEDPPREDVAEAIETAKRAGVAVCMITGDNKETALAIAKQVGIAGRVLEGDAIDQMSDDELSAVAKDISIFARVSPGHKLKIVKALKANSQIVAMTGDGVNDAPALKEADIGVAMGENGTDVTREVADLTLKDDNFATIVSAIKEGRTIFTNIRKFAAYQLSCNFSELILVIVATVINLPLPLIALQILFMNLITDDLPAISLGFNPSSKDVMTSAPRKNSNILNSNLMILIAIVGLFMGLVSLAVFYISYQVLEVGIDSARTYTFIMMILFQLIGAFGFRSLRAKIMEIPLTSNIYLFYASIISLIATVIVIYTPANKVFGTQPISPFYWLMFLPIAFSLIALLDFLKAYSKRKKKFLYEFF